jgi:hypothetical protein
MGRRAGLDVLKARWSSLEGHEVYVGIKAVAGTRRQLPAHTAKLQGLCFYTPTAACTYSETPRSVHLHADSCLHIQRNSKACAFIHRQLPAHTAKLQGLCIYTPTAACTYSETARPVHLHADSCLHIQRNCKACAFIHLPAQAVRHKQLGDQARVLFQASPRAICGGWIVSGTYLARSTYTLHPQYISPRTVFKSFHLYRRIWKFGGIVFNAQLLSFLKR